MDFLPHFPIHFNSLALFGLTLLLGLVGGEIARRTRYLPIISGYIAIGFLVGPGGFNFADQSVLATSQIFVEISVCLILFELGRHLDFRWLYRDRGLIPMSVSESFLTLIVVTFIVHYFISYPWLQAIMAGTIAMATSPAVVMLVANDLSAEGPVKRRALILTSMNNLFALIVFNIFLPMINSENSTSLNMIFIAYHLFGAFILSLFMFFLTQILALLIGKNRVNQFVLFIGVVVLTTSLSYLFHVSAMLTLFSLGVLARNLDHHHLLMEVDFGWLARLFFILLFVVTGAHLQLHGLTTLFGGILLIILARTLTKTFGIYLFSKKSKLSPKQAFALSLALSPMAGVAIGLSNILIDFNPEFGYHLLLIITGVVTVLHILGPIATQLSFIISDEALSIRQHHFERTS